MIKLPDNFISVHCKNQTNAASNINPKTLRIIILFGLIIYSAFGFLDPFMLPINYKKIWIIRFLILNPVLVIVFILSYYDKFMRFSKIILRIILILGQVGIVIMIYLADVKEEAYWSYYAGLILITLWSGFIFRVKLFETILFFITTILLYNIVAIYFQKLIFYGIHSKEFAWFLGNNFFLIAAGILTIVGAYILEKYNNEIYEENKRFLIAKDKAEESDKLKTAFLSNISHEIRTPLNGILGFTKLLSKPGLTEQKRENFINIITKSGIQLTKIIDDILDVSRIETGQMLIFRENISINDLISDIYNEFSLTAKNKNLELISVYVSELVYFICTDKKILKKILNKILDNAIKFTNNGFVKFGAEINNNQIQFFVEDTGIGIDNQLKDKIFDCFRQAEIEYTREFGGLGLGLTLSKKYIDLLEGRIWVESIENKGSTFYFTIPQQ